MKPGVSPGTAKEIILAQPRTAVGKELKKLRTEGWLPVHCYGKDLEPKALQVRTAEFEKVFKKAGETDLVSVKIGDHTKLVIIKNLQIDPESQEVIHADFYQVGLDQNNARSKLPLAMAIIVLPLFVLLFLFTQKITQRIILHQEVEKKVLAAKDQAERFGAPVRLKIPGINVDAAIEYVGMTSRGEMEVPSSSVDVGWFNLGPRPGEKGSAVIAGHLDGKNGEKGVFANLYKLKEGDKLYIEDDKGASTIFIVREKRTYDPGYADDVFSATGTHLNLITCDGAWDVAKKSYAKRLVVFADFSLTRQ